MARRLKVEWPKKHQDNLEKSPGKPLLDSDIRFPDTGKSANHWLEATIEGRIAGDGHQHWPACFQS